VTPFWLGLLGGVVGVILLQGLGVLLTRLTHLVQMARHGEDAYQFLVQSRRTPPPKEP
jgi:hypothetical protein